MTSLDGIRLNGDWGETHWRKGDWFRLPDTLHMDGRTFTGEIEAIYWNDRFNDDPIAFFQNGSLPVSHLQWAVRL